MSSTTTRALRNMAVPHDPAAGPIVSPTSALLSADGSDGAAASVTCSPSPHSRMEHIAPSSSRVSTMWHTSASRSGSGTLRELISSTVFSQRSSSFARAVSAASAR